MFIVSSQSDVLSMQELQYAQVQHCTTGQPSPPLPVEPVQYATVREQTDNTETEANTEPVQVC